MATYLRHIRLRILVTLHKFATRITPTLSGLLLCRPRGWMHADNPVLAFATGLSWCHLEA